jgi:hypothetical protein
MASPNIPKHIKADVQKLAYDRAFESIQRICDTFDNSADFLAIASSASMNASMLMLYCATRLKYGPDVSPHQLYKIWGETMEKEFDMMAKGFDAAQQYAKERHEK